MNVAIIGSGNIGTDLLFKILREKKFNLTAFVGRRAESDGIRIAKENGIRTSVEGIEFFKKNPTVCNMVFDCTNSFDAKLHAKIFSSFGIKVIDLTPAKVGDLCVPNINGKALDANENVNMITCGGQASIPMLNLISNAVEEIYYIEVVSQIASKSAGMATRINIDQYVETTEAAIKTFTKCENCKVILNLNPAEPEVDMQTTMFLKTSHINLEDLRYKIDGLINILNQYIPHYTLSLAPELNDGVLVVGIKVKGVGDYLPSYAGNLDIINCAAIEIAKRNVI